MIDKVIIESDEGGFRLILDGDLGDEVENYLSGRVDARLNLSLSSTAALELREQVEEQIEEWAATHDAVRADFERYKQTGEVPSYVSEDRLAKGAPLTPRREEGDASTSPSDLTEAERREAIRYGRSPLLGEGPPHDVVEGEFEDERQAALEAAYDRADYERKRDRENR